VRLRLQSRRKDTAKLARLVVKGLDWSGRGRAKSVMKLPLYLRFSLLSLLLLVTLAAVGVSHWLTSRRVARLEGQVAEQKRTIKTLNDQLGILTVEDPDDVHVIMHLDPHAESWHEELPLEFGWEIHIPPQTKWRLRWATGDIPITGLPGESVGEWLVDTGLDSQFNVRIDLSNSPARGWLLKVVPATNEFPHFIPNDETQWLNEKIPVAWDDSGGNLDEWTAETESFPTDDAIVLLRCRPAYDGAHDIINGWRPVPNNAPLADGLMIWLEPVSEN
jgi:hypothetical protein